MDYQNNVALYEKFQEYFRSYQVPLLAVWGKNDVSFILPGAEAFEKDLPRSQVKFLHAGHFASETHAEEIADEIIAFLGQLEGRNRMMEWKTFGYGSRLRLVRAKFEPTF